MKDIGASFKEAREFIGISEEEAASDMEITIAQLENLEDGNANAFKDVFFLKDLIKRYSKYLNLDGDKLIEEYNEFMFNFTSRIPITEIEKKVEQITKEEVKEAPNKILSPYTLIKEKKSKSKALIIIISIILLIGLAFFMFFLIKNRISKDDFVGINIMKGVNYEYTE